MKTYQAYLFDMDGTLVFEDFTAGIKAAAGSGCEVVAFAHEFNGNHGFGTAIKIITDYGEMVV